MATSTTPTPGTSADYLSANFDAETLDALKDLVRINVDSAQGWDRAAADVKDANLKAFFQRVGQQRAGFAHELRRFVEMRDEDVSMSSSLSATLHRWWIDLRSTVQGNEYAVLAEAERGEDVIKHTYEKTLPKVGGSPLMSVLNDQYAQVKATHDQVRDMRDSHK